MAATTAAMKTPFTREEIEFLKCTEDGRVGVLVRLIVNGIIDVNFQDEYGDTALMHVARWSFSDCQIDAVTSLIRRGADPNIQNVLGETALMLTFIRYTEYPGDNLKIVNTLIKNGADLNIQTKKGKTALMYAFHYAYYTNTMVKLLMKNGADVLMCDNRGQTVLDELHEYNRIGDPDKEEERVIKVKKYLEKKMKEAERMRLIKKRLELRAVRVGEEVLGLTRDEYMEKLHEDHKMAEELSKVDE